MFDVAIAPALPVLGEQPGRLTPLLFDETLPSTTITYTYDSLYRLTDAVYSNGLELHYTYDPVGNRLTQTTCAPDVPLWHNDVRV